MSNWIIYRSDDASSPGNIPNTAGALLAVIRAVLVNGYPGKAAAGWTEAFTGTNRAAFLQGSGGNGHYLDLDDTGTTTARVVGYETMSAVGTGTNPFPTAAQMSGGLYVYKSLNSTGRPWVIGADSKRFVMYIGHDDTTIAGSTTVKANYFFGKALTERASDGYDTLIIANDSSAISGNSFGASNTTFTASGGHYMARNNAATAGAIGVGKPRPSRGTAVISGNGSAGTAYPDPVTGGVILEPALIQEPSGNLTRARIPGVWLLVQPLPGSPGDTFSGTGVLAGKTFILLDSGSAGTRGRIALETSNTVES